MNYLLVFVLPSIFGFKLIYDNVDKKDKLLLFIYECMLLVLTNLVCTILVVIKNKSDYGIVEYAASSMKFSIIYIILSIFISCIIGFIIVVIYKYMSINIEVKHEKKERNKNNKSIKDNK